jgi:hypothetical protein
VEMDSVDEKARERKKRTKGQKQHSARARALTFETCNDLQSAS